MSEEQKKVSYTVFSAVMGIFVVAMGWVFMQHAEIMTRTDSNRVQQTKIEVQLSAIQTDLVWIKEKLIELDNP